MMNSNLSCTDTLTAKDPGGGAPGLFVQLLSLAVIQPFTNIICNYICSNRNDEFQNLIHAWTPPLRVGLEYDSTNIVPYFSKKSTFFGCFLHFICLFHAQAWSDTAGSCVRPSASLPASQRPAGSALQPSILPSMQPPAPFARQQTAPDHRSHLL